MSEGQWIVALGSALATLAGGYPVMFAWGRAMARRHMDAQDRWAAQLLALHNEWRANTEALHRQYRQELREVTAEQARVIESTKKALDALLRGDGE